MGDNYSWNGGSGDFSDPSQWTDDTDPKNTGTTYPQSGDTAAFDSGGQVSGSGDVADLEVTSAVEFDADISADGITNSGQITVSSETLSTPGELTDTGQINLDGGTLSAGFASEDGQDTVGPSGLLSINGDLAVGDTQSGMLTIESGGTVVSGFAQIGNQAGASGSVDVTGLWDDSAAGLAVGESGDGVLTIESGGTVISGFAEIGDQAGATGSVDVSGLWDDSAGDLAVGNGGSGTLTIELGGTVISGFAEIGDQAGATGSVDVTGLWDDSAGDLAVGNGGSGTLTIEPGGTVASGYAEIGVESGANGGATASGDGATWDAGASLFVGEQGSGTLDISNGASVVVDGYMGVGAAAGGTGTVTVDDASLTTGPAVAPETPTQAGDLSIGFDSDSAMTIADGATVNVNGGIYVGADDGAASASGTLTIESGASVTANGDYGVRLGQDPGSSGTLILTGAGSALYAGLALAGSTSEFAIATAAGTGTLVIADQAFAETGHFYVGASVQGYDNGGSATGTIESGATVEAGEGGVGANGSTGTLVVDDALWSVADEVAVGEEGGTTQSGNGTLVVQDGGVVSDVTGDIGASSPGNGQAGAIGTVTVTGDGSQWDNSGDLLIGDGGTGVLTIEDGGSVSVGDGLDIGVQAGASGTVTLADDLSSITIDGPVTIGDAGTGTFTLASGSNETIVGDIDIGAQQGSDGQVYLEPGAYLQDQGNLTVGDQGTGLLQASGASRIDDEPGMIAVGNNGGDGTVRFDDDAGMISDGGLIGGGSGGKGDFELNGSGVTWTNHGNLNVGQGGTGLLHLQNGARFDDDMGMVAVGEDSGDGTPGSGTIRFDDNPGMVSDSTSLGVDQGTQGSVQMDTGDWDNTGDLTVGDGGEGDLDLSDDASLTVGGDLDEAEQDDSTGDASIDDSTIGITGALTVGDDGTGTFDISDGGQVTAASLTIAAQDDSGTADDPSTVTVDGDGSTLTIEGDAEVGGQAYGALIVSDGANATIDGTLNVDQNYNGFVQVAAASTTTVMDDADVANMATALVQVQGTFEVEGDTTIGVDAGSQGTIVIEGDGATMTTTDLTVGGQGTGTLMLTGDSVSLSVGGDLVVGDSGTGVMVVAGGAALSVSGETITVAMEAGSNATLTFNAADFTYAGTIVVGDQGNGALFVQLGANITVDTIEAGETQGAIGQLNVDSAVLTINDDLTVGSAGAGTLNLTDGAMVLVGSDATFGETGVGVVQRLSIDTGAILAIDGDFKFGDGGIAAGTVQGAGQIGVSGTATLGGQTNASGVLTLTGNNATHAGGTAANLAYGDALVVGESGFGTLDILQGATVAPLMANPGSHDVAIGAAAGGSGTVVVDGAASLLSANTLAVGGSVARPGGSGTLVVSDGGLVQAVDVTVWASGVISLQGGTIETDPMTIIGAMSGPGVITGDVTDDGTVIATGGTLDLTGTVSGPGALVIDPDSELDLGGDQGTGITFAPGGNETLAIDAPFSDATAVSGLANGDAIVVAGSAEVTAQISYGSTSTTVSLLQNGADVGGFLLAGSYAPGSLQTSTSGDTLTVTEIPCFLAGTAIATARGEQVVEALRIGDTVWLADGGTAAIVWIGDRRADAWRHPDPDAVLPIRITAGACGPGQPRRDLLVSPDHAVCLDGMLIPARLLVNGNSIRQDRRIGRPHYYHVELDRHAVLLAEGLPAESYLDTGNRAAFAAGRGVAVLWPDFAGGDRGGRSCLPFVTDPACVRPIWERLAGREANAVAEPPAIPAPVLLADNVAIAPVITGETLSYALPPRCQAAWLVSAVRRPSEAAPWLDDRRALGVCVSRIALVGADDTRVIAPDDPALADGWWPSEADGARHWRWTRAAAAIPLRAGTVAVQVRTVGLRIAAADTQHPGRPPLPVRRCAGGDGSRG